MVRGLENGTGYFFEVVAQNGSGTGPPSEEVFAVPQAGIPFAPHLLKGYESSMNGIVHLAWTPSDSTHGATFTVYRSQSPHTAYVLVQDEITQNSYNDSTLLEKGTYYYRVGAGNNKGTSWSLSQILTIVKNRATDDLTSLGADLTEDFCRMPGIINPVRGEQFGPLQSSAGLAFEILVCDLKGETVFSGGENEYWDVTRSGDWSERGIYVWRLKGIRKGKPFFRSGKVMIMY